MTERLQKCIAQSGACSRRQAESWIREGRVTVNGESAVLGQSVDPATDRICIDGRPLELSESEMVYIMLNKPRGYVSTVQDERGRKTIMELVSDVGERLYPVGRLDMYSQGLLLMTNDGTLTKALTHPSHDVKKEYQVRVVGDVSNALDVLRAPMSLDGVPLKRCSVRVLSRSDDSWLLLFGISEGRNRQIRRMCEIAGLRVVRLRRVSEGGVRLGNLQEGKWRYLTQEEVDALYSVAELQK